MSSPNLSRPEIALSRLVIFLLGDHLSQNIMDHRLRHGGRFLADYGRSPSFLHAWRSLRCAQAQVVVAGSGGVI